MIPRGSSEGASYFMMLKLEISASTNYSCPKQLRFHVRFLYFLFFFFFGVTFVHANLGMHFLASIFQDDRN